MGILNSLQASEVAEEMGSSSVKEFFTTLSLSRILPALVIVVVGIIAVKLFCRLFEKVLGKSRLDRSMHGFLLTVFKILLYTIVILIAAGALGINTSSLVAVLSVLTLAISLAVQGTLSNVAGGIQVISSHPFKENDFVEIGTMTGTVREISPLYTVIISPDGKIVHIPNSVVASSTVINYSAYGSRRVELQFSASYDSDPDQVMEALRKAADSDKILKDRGVFVSIRKYEDSAILYEVRVWVKPEDYWDVYFGIINAVHAEFGKADVIMTYPHLNVHLDQ